MHKAQHRDPRALAVRLVNGDAVDHGRVRLPVIQGDHRDGVAVLGEKPREDRLLDFGAADDLDVRIAREHRPDIRRDEAQMGLGERRRGALGSSLRGAAGLSQGRRHVQVPARRRASCPYIIPMAIQRKANSGVGRRLEPAKPVTMKQSSPATTPW